MLSQSLQKELEQVKNLNSTVDLLIDTARNTRSKILTLKGATNSTSALLEDWIRILNQTQFTRSVLEDPQWKGPDGDEFDHETYLKKEAELEAELRAIEADNEKLSANLNQLQNSEEQLKQRRWGIK